MSADEMTGTTRPESAVPRTPSQARTKVEALLREWLMPARGVPDTKVVGDAVLVTSELVTNALRHGGGMTSFDVEMTDDGCRVSVGDRSDRLPELASPPGRQRQAARRGPRLAGDPQTRAKRHDHPRGRRGKARQRPDLPGLRHPYRRA
ncbi:ATP-binding protein [Streptomyces wuyuanensis]|uniref:Anti-sigma regulatory factor (Ser/Thr protein kinase) n=1 Tax=Streptomyces wuyuanensis TaxID=1196353 RepID=A0A1G9N2F3_9ACTN|nr:ATP-binding protein [Streptomyces wuyuanensis]SDL80307.1 hypothetical protein SAMN05444921_101421 [Streptomyces wuyuanensis]